MPKSGKLKKTKNKKNSNFFGTVSIKETYRKILKRYDRLSANAEKLALPSIRKSLRYSIDNEIILVKVYRATLISDFYDAIILVHWIPWQSMVAWSWDSCENDSLYVGLEILSIEYPQNWNCFYQTWLHFGLFDWGWCLQHRSIHI